MRIELEADLKQEVRMSEKSRDGNRGKTSSKEKQIRLIEELGASAFGKLRANQADEAKSELEKAVSLSQDAGAGRIEVVLRTYLAQAEKMLGNIQDACAGFDQVIEISRQSEFIDLEILARVFLAELLRDKGEYARALHHFEAAYNCASYLKDGPAMELTAGNLGSVALSLGQLEQACGWFKTAVDLDQGNMAIWLGSLGLTMCELGQFGKAHEYYQRAFDLAKEHEDILTMSICRGSIGNVFFEQKQYKDAKDAYESAGELAAQAEDVRRQGIWLGNVGISLSRLGDQDAAYEKLTGALNLAQTIDDKQSMAAHLDSLGDCKKAAQELAASDAYYRQAIEIAEEISDRLGERIYLSNLARLKRDNGELDCAFEYFSKAVDLFDEQRGFIKADDLKTSFADRGQELYRDVISTCLNMGRRVEALEYVGRAKSRALLDLLSNSPIDVSVLGTTGGEDRDGSLKNLITREAELRAQIAQLERLYWQGDGPAPGGSNPGQMRSVQLSQEDTRKLYGEWREVLNQLKRRHPNYASLVSSTTLKYAEIQGLWQDGLLKEDTGVVEFFLSSDYLLVAAAVKEEIEITEPYTHILMDAGELENLKSDIFTFLEMSSTEGWEVPVSLCKRLYNRLLAPVLEKLPAHITRLILVPHGMLYHLPFSALHDGQGYLCQKYSIGYVPSLSLIPILKSERSSKSGSSSGEGSYLVSAISDYSKTREGGMVYSSRLRSSAGLEDLAYTMEEARNIAHLGQSGASGSTLLTNEEVKQSLPKMFGEHEIVHFAGHAVFNHDEPLASGLVLSDGSILSAASILEGNTLRTERGKLLVLSACQTGVNVVTEGGEILGLARALMYAGMPNLVLSLWEVADRSTADLMQDFHQFLQSGWQVGKGSIADALRQAQLKAIADKQPIHAWAPFIHFGID